MHAVIVSDFGEVNGGAAKVAVTSARSLAETGHSVTFVCAIGPVSPLLSHPRIDVRCLGFEDVWSRVPIAGAVQAIWNRRARKGLDKILETVVADETIVHFHQWTKAFSPSVLAAPSRLGLPAVASLHDYFLACPNGAYYHFPDARPCRLRPMSAACVAASCDRNGNLHKAVRVLRQYTTQMAMARAGSSLSLISVSSFAERVIDGFLPKCHARFVVRPPVESVPAPPVAVARNREFLFVGRLTEEKGVWKLACTARDLGIPLVISGDGPLFKQLARLGGTVRCTGWLDAAELRQLMNRARALVFPSTWYETGGLVVLEALARGIPVIVSHTTAAAEFIVDGVNGYLIDPGNSEMLAARMQSLADDGIAASIGDEAHRRYWTSPMTVNAHTGNLLAVYRAMLSAHRASLPSANTTAAPNARVLPSA